MSLSLLSTIFLSGSSLTVDVRRLALESSSADWFSWVTRWGYVVAFGCAMEAWEVWITIKNWWLFRFRKRGIPEDKGSWASPLAAFGLMLIVAGIMLETYCEGRVADAETQLRNLFSETLITAENEAASATRDAGTAKQSALIAATAAREAITAGKNATAVASAARREADTFEKDIVSAKQQAADAESHLADALQRAANAESQIHRVTAPVYLVPVIRGVATPDLTAGFSQRIVLTSDATINEPILPPMEKGGSVSWTLFLDQDKTGGHKVVFSFSSDLTQKVALMPSARSTMEFLTESSGRTTLRGLPMWNFPIDANPNKPPNAKKR